MSENRKFNQLKLNDHGFTLIESLVAIAIFGIMFMALTTAIWSATTNYRTTSYADESVIAAQDVVEMLSVIDINNVTSPAGGWTTLLPRGNQRIRYSVVNTNTSGDFKTIAIEVFYSDNAVLTADELRMKTYYRRMMYQ